LLKQNNILAQFTSPGKYIHHLAAFFEALSKNSAVILAGTYSENKLITLKEKIRGKIRCHD
jgi:hypothetical protein